MEHLRIPVNKILLSNDNPRLEPSFSEDEAMRKMITNQGEKLVTLAADIGEFGLNPLETVAVYPSDIYPDYYVVAEGNRRVCALKLLINPSILEPINSSLFSKFTSLSAKISVPNEIDTVLFAGISEVEHWMEIRHMGEQSGKGLSRWNALQKMRFTKNQTGENALLDFWDWMDTQGILSSSEIYQVTKTNWQRILREGYFPFLKLQYDGRYSVNESDIGIFTERIRAIQKNLCGQSVGIVYDQERIDQFYDRISRELYGEPYSEIIKREQKGNDQLTFLVDGPTQGSSNANDKDVMISFPPDQQEKETDTTDIDQSNTGNIPVAPLGVCPLESEADDSAGTIGQPTKRDPFNGCKTIIPWTYGIRSANMRLNKIVQELKKLDPDDYPNACGTLLRALFELSAKVYLEAKTQEDMTEKEFQQVIRGAADHLRAEGKIQNSEHSAIIKDVDSLRLIFNGYMHNTDSYPSSMALKNLFKAHINFIDQCLR